MLLLGAGTEGTGVGLTTDSTPAGVPRNAPEKSRDCASVGSNLPPWVFATARIAWDSCCGVRLLIPEAPSTAEGAAIGTAVAGAEVEAAGCCCWCMATEPLQLLLTLALLQASLRSTGCRINMWLVTAAVGADVSEEGTFPVEAPG